jgi:uncharacterized protein
MSRKIIGRENEIAKFDRILASPKAEFTAVYGRRRVGKTFLIKQYFKNGFTFYATGLANGTTEQQLAAFTNFINQYFKCKYKPCNDWMQTFELLIKLLKKNKDKKQVLFIDELPWLDTKRSDFLTAFEYFWNAWASTKSKIKLFVCGSAASWMIKKILRNKAGLHNRLTARIKLEPFNLYETEQFFRSKNIVLDRYQIIQLYMAMGGIPYYLDEVQKGLSAAQNIQQMCFDKNGLLKDEFTVVFDSLFGKGKKHDAIVRLMYQLGGSCTREQIIEKAGLASGGDITTKLKELEESGFVTKHKKYGTNNAKMTYSITDFYTLFYLKFIEPNSKQAKLNWITSLDNTAVRAWSGFTFEQICLQHSDAIKYALQIGGIPCTFSTWRKMGNSSVAGAQIDMVIDRSDKVIHLCEMKFSTHSFEITKAYDLQLRNKVAAFRSELKSKKSVFLTFVTTYGLADNAYRKSAVQNELTMDALFTKTN